MKQCSYCDSQCEDTAKECPHCGGNIFTEIKKTNSAPTHEVPQTNTNPQNNNNNTLYFLAFVGFIIISCMFLNSPMVKQYKVDRADQEIYENGNRCLQNGDYQGAMNYYSQVSDSSKYYDDAQIAFGDARAQYVRYVVNVTDGFYESHDYVQGINYLNSAKSFLGYDDSIEFELQTMERTYCNELIEQARELYCEYDDLESALSVIAEGIEFLPEEENLIATQELLYSANPRSILGLSDDYIDWYEFGTDAYGNQHQGKICCFYPYHNYGVDKTDAEVLLLEKYERFTSECFISKMDEGQWAELFIYADGELLYDSGILDRHSRSEDFDLNVEGVYSLQIKTIGSYVRPLGDEYSYHIQLGNPTFYHYLSPEDFDPYILEFN